MATFIINGIDITSGVLLNTFNYMKRIDDVYGTGTFVFESKTITDNIPPYSVLMIDDDCFLCSSEATYHYGSHYWVHTVSVIEATSILSRFLVGTKIFSITGTNTHDYDKISILLQLINQKYGVNIVYNSSSENSGNFEKEIEYSFTAGTTLFDALNEIEKNYNYRIYVSNIDGNNIYINHLDLEDLSLLNLTENKILAKTKTQNPETYCKFLETEANNVIDTTNTSLVDNIYPTASDVKLSEDTYMLKLPTPIYKIKSFWANLSANIETALQMPNSLPDDPVLQTYEEWAKTYPVLNDIYDIYYAEYFPNWNEFKKQGWIASNNYVLTPYNDKMNISLEGTQHKVDLTWRIKSKEQYDLVEDKDKPDYVYYQLGNNVIDGFNIFYKNDFWNTLIGKTKEPFYLHMGGTIELHKGEVYQGVEIFAFRVVAENNIFKTTYGVEYYPLSNPMLINVKTDTPENETNYKPYALSYGNSSNYVDFDKLNNSIKVENQTTGKVEMIIEYDITGRSFMHEYKTVRYNGKEWYVSNSQYKITPTQSVVILNLVSNYNKVADVISLNSQYNTTRNPLQDIIERPVYVESTQPFSFTKGKSYIVATFEFANGTTTDLFFSPIILTNNEDIYFYFETTDQYSGGSKAVNVEGQTFKVEQVPYVDSNNEVVKCSFKKVDLENINYEIAKNLPSYPKWMLDYPFYQKVADSFVVYKDAREKLTFTIKANNCIIR